MALTYKQFTNMGQYISDYFQTETFDCAIILGSGLGPVVDEITEKKILSYEKIPGFPSPTVPGHHGNIVAGIWNGKKVIAFQGRLHLYEGLHITDTVIPIRILQILKVQNIILTNASGGLNEQFSVGEIALIDDHINYAGYNPLIGENIEEFGPRFPSLTEVYDKEWIQYVQKNLSAPLNSGSYAFFSGPNYETAAEIKLLQN